jgi:hypothetical protein
VPAYQLVLQWPATQPDALRDLIEIEDALRSRLDPVHDVDGHDLGAGEMNIFVLTDGPLQAFEQSRSALADCSRWEDVRVAYRPTDGHEYTVLWPKDQHAFRLT